MRLWNAENVRGFGWCIQRSQSVSWGGIARQGATKRLIKWHSAARHGTSNANLRCNSDAASGPTQTQGAA